MTGEYATKITKVKEAMDVRYENKQANKKTDISGSFTNDADSYPTVQAVKTYIDGKNYLTQHQDISNYVQKSNTTGLLKNDGTVDTSTYLTQHQDISGKANSADLATVATSGSYTDLTNVPQTFTPASHTHGNITATGAIGSDSGKMITTTTNGILVASDMNEQLNSIILGLIAEGTPSVPLQDIFTIKLDLTNATFPYTFKLTDENEYAFVLYDEADDTLVIDWGDGTQESYPDSGYDECSTITHTYTEGTIITITVDSVTTMYDNYVSNMMTPTYITEITIPSYCIDLRNPGESLSNLTTMNLMWDSAEEMQYVDGTNEWIGNSDIVFTIPYGTTSLYLEKGFSSNQLTERSQ